MLALLVVVLGCSTERDLGAVPAGDAAPSPGEDVDTDAGGSDTGLAVIGWTSSECPPSTVGGDGLLPLDGCVRLTPEADQDWPNGLGPCPKCGYFNLLGTFAMAGSSSSPAVLYCDSDEAGGVRFDRWDGASLTSTTVDAGECFARPGTGALVDLPDGGWRALWTVPVTDGDARWTAQRTLDVAADGTVGAPSTFDLGYDAVGIALTGDLLLALDDGGVLRGHPLAGDTFGRGTVLASSVTMSSSATVPDGAAIAWCDDRNALHVGVVGPDAHVLRQVALPANACSYSDPPTFAAAPDGRLALGWNDRTADEIDLLSSDLDVVAEVALPATSGPLPLAPAAIARGDGWLVLSGDGTLSSVDAGGSVVATWLEPDVATLAADAERLTLLPPDADGTLAVAHMGTDVVSVGQHTDTYEFLDVSRVTLPPGP